MTKKPFLQKIAGLPVAILPTMVGTATLSNMWAPLGFTWIRHLTMWAAAIIFCIYLLKIIFHFNVFKKEYSATVPASLYAGFTMLLMILGSYVFDYSPVIGKIMWATGLSIHTVHLLIFIYRNVIKGVKIETFIPSWFVTFNGIMVSTVVGTVMNEPTICTIVVYYGIAALFIIMPFMIVRLIKHPIADPFFQTQAVILAPSSLCVVGYLNIIQTPNPLMVYVLYTIVFISLIYVVFMMPKFFTFDFHPGFAGLTFPMAIGIVASNKMSAFLVAQNQELLGSIIKQIAGLQLYITTGIIIYVLFNFYCMLVNSYKTSTKN